MVRCLGEDPYERALAIRTAAWLEDPGADWASTPPSRVTGAVLGLAIDPWWLSDAVAHLRAAGVAVEALDQPFTIAPALSGAPLLKAWHLPTARVADAHALVSGFVRGARSRGAVLRMGTQVRQVVQQGGTVRGVDTDQGLVEADAVVLAAGAWSSALAHQLGLERPLVPVRRTLMQSRAHGLSTPNHPWVWVDDVGVYARPEAGGWLCSGCDETVDPPTGPNSRGPVDPEQRARAASKLDRYLPALGDVQLHKGWTGLRTFAPDRRPVLGADPDLPGLWWAAGLGGFGVSVCKGVGEALEAWMMGEELGWLRPRGVSPGRDFPRRWPIRPTGDIQNTHLIES
jgi:glycine/D-amino acid oxidase-like deaminating enzyme